MNVQFNTSNPAMRVAQVAFASRRSLFGDDPLVEMQRRSAERQSQQRGYMGAVFLALLTVIGIKSAAPQQPKNTDATQPKNPPALKADK